ncbi:MAG TPA: hypothetical protein VFD63_08300, partial [Pyrinomonadaceae bacterium]|nr:hypothetical protein [Pyrinomonadaceae bacterium]
MQSGRWAERQASILSPLEPSVAPALNSPSLCDAYIQDEPSLWTQALRDDEARAGATLGSSAESIDACRSAHLPDCMILVGTRYGS